MTPAGVPLRNSLAALPRALWAIVTTAVRTFVWGTLRAGAIDFRPLSRALRAITICGLLLIAGFLFSILFNNLLRTGGPLEPLAVESSATRGLLVPPAAVPLTLVVLTLAWGYALTGALHVRGLARWLVFLLYVLYGILPLAPVLLYASNLGEARWLWLAPIGLVAIAFLVLPRRPLPLPIVFSLMLALHAMLMMLALAESVRAQILSDGQLRASDLVTAILQTGLILIAPFLFVAGLGWVDFALEVSGWLAKAVRQHATTAIVGLLLIVLLGARLLAAAGGGMDDRQWAASLGASVFCAGLGVIALWRRRLSAGGAVPRRLIVTLILVVLLAQIALSAVIQVSVFVVSLDPLSPAGVAAFDSLSASVEFVGDLETQFRALYMTGIGLLVAWIAGRRGHPTVATYGLIFAWRSGLAWLMESGRPLYGIRFTHADVEPVLLLVFAGVTLFWLVRRGLTGERATSLLALALLMAVLNETGFLDNPFSPLFGFAGVFFLVFGILWSVLTAGGQLTNRSSPGFPRAGRLLLYVGYVLFSVSVAHWYLVSHNLPAQIVQGDFNFTGFRVFGLPLAYLALVEGGRSWMNEEA